MSRKPELTTENVRAAIERAKAGKGRQLAALIKGCSLDDLARGFSNIGPHYADMFDEGVFLAGLTGALAYVEGCRISRGELAQWKKDARAKARAARKSKSVLVETSCARDGDAGRRA